MLEPALAAPLTTVLMYTQVVTPAFILNAADVLAVVHTGSGPPPWMRNIWYVIGVVIGVPSA
jgi:hypothetical protein